MSDTPKAWRESIARQLIERAEEDATTPCRLSIELAREMFDDYSALQSELSALRAKLAASEKDAKRFNGLQNMPPIEAQAFFWNFQSRKQRAAAIDAAIEKERGNG